MDIAPVQRTSSIADTPSPTTRPSIQPAGIPVATDLSTPATVQQASAGHAADGDRPFPSSDKPPLSPDGQPPVVERNLSIDPETQQIVFQAINSRGEIVLQLPDQVVLRQRAYANDLESAAEKSSRSGAVERFV